MAINSGPSSTFLRVRAVLALAAAGTVLAACGSSSKGASSANTGTGTSSTASTSPTAAASTKASSGSGSVNLGGGSFCDKARKAETDAASAATKVTDGPDALKQLEENAHAELSQLADQAPSQIKGSVSTLVNAEDQFFNALQNANFDVTKVDTSALSSFNTPQVMQAIDQIDSYLVTKCGLSPSDFPTESSS
jgi:hypothetical protein